MDKNKILINLDEIKKIAEFQAKRIEDENAVNKELILKQALDFIRNYTIEIEKELK